MGALAALSRKYFIARRIVDDSDLDSARSFQCDGDAEAGIAVRVVCGPIERIDDPPILGAAFSEPAFLSKDFVARIIG